MATIQDRLDRYRTLHYVDNNQYSDTSALSDINSLIREACLFQKSNWDIWKTNSVNGQNEYEIKELQWDPNLTIINLEKLWLKYGTEYKLATKISYNQFDSYTKWTESAPIFYERDGSVFIYPAFDEVVTEWIKIEATYMPAEVTLATDLSDVKLPLWVLDTLFEYWLAYYIEMEKGNKWDALNLRSRYREELSLKKRLAGQKVTRRSNDLPQNINWLI